jgi:hypothetical protein
MFALWIEVLLLNIAVFLIGLGIAWLIWGREEA